MSTTNIKRYKELPIELLKEYFEVIGQDLVYTKTWKKMVKGKRAGNINKDGYVDIGFMKNRYYAHRISYAIYHGKWPDGVVDHIDGNKLNNSPTNLRDCTDTQNNCNHKGRSNNTSGFIGVSAHSGGFSAEIRYKKQRYRKWFKLRQDAVNWEIKMRIHLHKQYTNDNLLLEK